MTMTERVAKAIYETNPIAKWPPASDSERAYWLAAARAAIAAMREPTEAMLAELALKTNTQSGVWSVASWQVMIDAALKEK